MLILTSSIVVKCVNNDIMGNKCLVDVVQSIADQITMFQWTHDNISPNNTFIMDF